MVGRRKTEEGEIAKEKCIFKYKSSEADCCGAACMRIISVLQHLSKYVKIPESATRLLADNGEIQELFV